MIWLGSGLLLNMLSDHETCYEGILLLAGVKSAMDGSWEVQHAMNRRGRNRSLGDHFEVIRLRNCQCEV
jgi:hypothetical protein